MRDDPPRVFVSYSHDSSEHAERVLLLADRLRSDGIEVNIDQYEISPPEGWQRWMDRQIRDAKFVLMVCTENYYRRVMGDENVGVGLGVRWEGNLIYQQLYDSGTSNTKFIPVLLSGCKAADIPGPTKSASYYFPESDDGYENLYRRLTNQPRARKPTLGILRELPSRERKWSSRPSERDRTQVATNGHANKVGSRPESAKNREIRKEKNETFSIDKKNTNQLPRASTLLSAAQKKSHNLYLLLGHGTGRVAILATGMLFSTALVIGMLFSTGGVGVLFGTIKGTDDSVAAAATVKSGHTGYVYTVYVDGHPQGRTDPIASVRLKPNSHPQCEAEGHRFDAYEESQDVYSCER